MLERDREVLLLEKTSLELQIDDLYRLIKEADEEKINFANLKLV